MTLNIKQKLSTWNKHPFLVIGALISPFVIFVVGYMFIYVPIAGYFEKKDFVAAEKKLDELQAKIIATIGAPSKVEEKKRCGYSSAKFDGGRLGCHTGFTLAYPTENETEATRTAGQLFNILRDSPGISYISEQQSFNVIQHPYNPQRIIAEVVSGDPGISCRAYVEYGNSSGGITLSDATSAKSVAIAVSCGGDAISEHFPLEK